MRASSTAPGLDEIPLEAIKLAWPHIGFLIRDLFSMCLLRGWHPTPFRTVILCAIEKPGKRDRTSPRSYRLISLLSILGKGLEPIVACRFAHLAIQNRVLPMRYFGALPARAASDLTYVLVDDMNE
jgi:hypothetical protein